MAKQTFSVFYRTGGTENFQWHRVFERYETVEQARACVDEIERGGRVAHYCPTHLLDSVGLPDTYE